MESFVRGGGLAETLAGQATGSGPKGYDKGQG